MGDRNAPEFPTVLSVVFVRKKQASQKIPRRRSEHIFQRFLMFAEKTAELRSARIFPKGKQFDDGEPIFFKMKSDAIDKRKFPQRRPKRKITEV